MNNELYEIASFVMNNPYKYGHNDCNITALRVLDLIAGTEYAQIAQYDSVLQGFKQLKEHGFSSVQEIIKQHSDETQFPIDGDIWIDEENPVLMGLVFSDRLLGIDETHTQVTLLPLTEEGKYYRIRKK